MPMEHGVASFSLGAARAAKADAETAPMSQFDEVLALPESPVEASLQMCSLDGVHSPPLPTRRELQRGASRY